MVFSAGIGHGDRFRVSDLDPDRPGLETYAVQQEDLLGQMIYDAATGEHLHDWYMTEIIDVGRGECMDIDSTAKGYELFSIINGNVYDCKGNVLQGITAPYPYEGIWWSGSRLRDNFASPGGKNYTTNINIEKVLGGERYFEISRECDWNIHAGPAVRPMFIGDIIGDWREEFVVLYNPGGRNMGLRGFSTNYPTENSMYCLQEDAHYHGDCTTRGYYQSPNTSFYLGGGMPYPPLPSSMVTDLRWRGGNAWDNSASNFTTFDLKTSATFADGKSVMFDISGDSTQIIHLTSTVAPSATYFMVPREHTYNISGGGAIGGTGEIWKSEWGTVNINANFTTSGKTVVSDGILNLNGRIEGPLSLRAKGTLGGNVRLNGNVSFEGALNYDGCRLSPGTPSGYGKMLLSKALNINRPIYVESNIGDNGICDTLRCLEAISIPDTIAFTILAKSNKNSELAGTYTLMQASGGLSVNAAKVGIRNLVGMPYEVSATDTSIVLTIRSARDAEVNVKWAGTVNDKWDYLTENFTSNSAATAFVKNDRVLFADDGAVNSVVLNQKMVQDSITFNIADKFTLSGVGGISGKGSLVKMGSGELVLNLDNSDYTGATLIKGGTLSINSI